VRRLLLRYRGMELDTAGDSFFASFDGPARDPLRACDHREHPRSRHRGAGRPTHGRVRVHERQGRGDRRSHRRAGRSRGRPERGRRLEHGQGPVAGSGIAFRERGTAELKGVPDE
jgi:hypothetical protein